MRKNMGVNAYMYPMPVLIIAAYDKDGKADAMNAAWGWYQQRRQNINVLKPRTQDS